MPELRIQRASMHRESINKAAGTFRKNPNASIAQVMLINYKEMKSIIAASGPLNVVQKYYWDALQFTPDSPPSAPPPSTSPPLDLNHNSGFTRSKLAMIIVIPILVAQLIAVSATLVIRGYKNRKSHNSFCDGDALPPGDSPNTTLVVTDIESSTTLWEKLDATVMDSALTIHHAVIREIARKHRGYENGTEGDSFTIAFHSPRSAVLFAVECQAKFVTCNWPEALLKLPLCEPKFNTQSDLEASGHQLTTGATEVGLMSSYLASQPALSIGLFHHSHEQQQCMSDELFSVPAPQPDGNRSSMDTMAVFDDHMTVHKFITSQCKPASGPGPGVVLLFKGLRVRMGIHAGVVDASDVAEPLAVAKLAMAPQLVQRCVFLGPPKTQGAASLSFLEAPYGQAAIVFMKAVGADSLPPDIIEDALGVYHQTAQHELMKYGGYLAEATLDGLLLAVFPEPLSAIRWSLHTIQACKLADWSEELLGHALGEEVHVQLVRPSPQGHEQSEFSEALEIQPQAPSSTSCGLPDWVDVIKVGSFSASLGHRDSPGMSAFAEVPQALHARASGTPSCINEAGALISTQANTAIHLRKGWLLFRGLRIKAGIEIGGIKTDIDPLTGQMAYRGRAMNRAARITGMTKTGMVWCSSAAWSAAHSTAVREEHTAHMRPGGGHEGTHTSLLRPGGGHEGTHTSLLRPGGCPDGIHPLTRPSPHHAQWGEPLRDSYSSKRLILAKHMAPHPEGVDEVTIRDKSFQEITNSKDETCLSLLNNASTTCGVASSNEPRRVADQAQSGSDQAQSGLAQAQSGLAQAQSGLAQAQSGSAQAQIELVEVKEAQGKVALVPIGSAQAQSEVVEVKEAKPKVRSGDPASKDYAPSNYSIYSEVSGTSITLTMCQPTMEDPPEKASDHVSMNSNVSSKASGNAITSCHLTSEDTFQKAMSYSTHTSGSLCAHESRENLPFNELSTIGEISREFPQLMACPNRPRNLSPRTSPGPRTTQVGVLGHTRFVTENSLSFLSQRVLPHLDVSHTPLGFFALKGIEVELELVQCSLNSNEPEPSSAMPSIPLPKLLKTYNDISTGGSTAGSAPKSMLSGLVRSGENTNARLGPNGPIRLGPNGTAERKRSVSMKTGLGTGISTGSKTTSKQLMTARSST
eukprot:gene26763-4341_t